MRELKEIIRKLLTRIENILSGLEHSVQEKKIIIFSTAINSLFMSFAKHINTETERKKRKYTLSIFMSFIPYYPIPPTYLIVLTLLT